MLNWKAAIVDDERPSRRRLRRLLSLEPEWEVVAECENGAEAVQALNATRPDLLLLDVQMPAMNGFEVLEAIAYARPLVIFTSAYEDYALRAFEFHAFDYLLKPFDGHRFRDSVRRASKRLAQEQLPATSHDLSQIFDAMKPRRSPDRMAVRSNGRVVFVRLEEIDWIEASDNYACLHCGRETHVIRETMNELEGRLDPALFVRVHRSAIVNLDRIRELQPWFRGDYRVILRDGTELTLTKNHREKLESKLFLGAGH